jgi:hypothetical protein
MATHILDAVSYIGVPAIMVSMLLYAVIICFSAEDGPGRAIAGGLAGVIILAVFVVSTVSKNTRLPNLNVNFPLTVNVAGIVAGLAVGFVASLIVKYTVHTAAVGIATLLLTTFGANGLYGYFFSVSLHQFLLYGFLFFALGWLIRVVLPIGPDG